MNIFKLWHHDRGKDLPHPSAADQESESESKKFVQKEHRSRVLLLCSISSRVFYSNTKMAQVNGTAPGATTPSTSRSTPTVVGINFGNTYASISVLNKVSGLKTCDA